MLYARSFCKTDFGKFKKITGNDFLEIVSCPYHVRALTVLVDRKREMIS
jgi:hypothetical protein